MGSVIKKKRGRPVGSKNKPKAIRITEAQANLAKRIDESVKRLKLNRKPRKKALKVNWEILAKQLQTALNDEIGENQGLSKRIDNLSFQVANLEHQAIGYRAVISYLENQLGNNKV